MSQPLFLSTEAFAGLVEDLLGDGTSVWAPVKRGERVEYGRIAAACDALLDGPLPAMPLKAVFLPPSEPLFTWRRDGQDVTLAPHVPDVSPAVVLGARPCDAAALDALDRVMGWDYRDDLWFARRDRTTIVTVACVAAGPDCFCDAVGLGPDDPTGSDVLLAPLDGGFSVREVTEKGRTLIARHPARFETRQRGASGPAGPAQPPRRLDTQAIGSWLASHFDDPMWTAMSFRCHGCGACASVCPACHCFDIVDEPESVTAGTRRRHWDTCQTAKFTLHASGHNPRGDQNGRFRQRVMHKFRVYPERFGRLLCTGCGRCAAACPSGQNLLEILHGLERAAQLAIV